MKSISEHLLSRRAILAIFTGVMVSVLLMTFVRNYVLATIVGMTIVAMVVDLREPIHLAILGSITGSIVGFCLGVMNYLALSELRTAFDCSRLVASMLGWAVLLGLVCAVYAFVIAKVRLLYEKGRGPFF